MMRGSAPDPLAETSPAGCWATGWDCGWPTTPTWSSHGREEPDTGNRAAARSAMD